MEQRAKTTQLNGFQKEIIDVGTDKLLNMSEPTLMKNDELNARAFMTVVRRGENSSNEAIGDPLGYNVNVGRSKFSSYKNHPNKGAAGAYQFKKATWDMVNKVEKQADFSPKNQDRAFIINVEIMNDDLVPGALEDLYSGNFVGAADKLKMTWTCLPNSGPESHMTMPQGQALFKAALANELAGSTVLDTPQGKLNTKKVYREN